MPADITSVALICYIERCPCPRCVDFDGAGWEWRVVRTSFQHPVMTRSATWPGDTWHVPRLLQQVLSGHHQRCSAAAGNTAVWALDVTRCHWMSLVTGGHCRVLSQPFVSTSLSVSIAIVTCSTAASTVSTLQPHCLPYLYCRQHYSLLGHSGRVHWLGFIIIVHDFKLCSPQWWPVIRRGQCDPKSQSNQPPPTGNG